MVCDGESVTLPDACELFTTVRDAPPALAVMVMEEALLACHVSVTLCPLPIDVLLAEKVKLAELGEPGVPGVATACDPQPVSVIKTIIAKKKKPVKRSVHDFIRALVPLSKIYPIQIQSCGLSKIYPIQIQSCGRELLPPCWWFFRLISWRVGHELFSAKDADVLRRFAANSVDSQPSQK